MGKRIVCYGDSNTYGYDPRDLFGRPYDHPWPELVAKKTGYEVLNLGIPGREIPAYERQFQLLMRDMERAGDVDLVFVMLGTNDLLNMYHPDAEVVRKRMERMLKLLLETLKAEQICLLIPPFIRMEDGYREESKRLGDCYGALCESLQIAILDTNAWDLPMAHDGVHIAEEGQEIFAEQIADYLNELKVIV